MKKECHISNNICRKLNTTWLKKSSIIHHDLDGRSGLDDSSSCLINNLFWGQKEGFYIRRKKSILCSCESVPKLLFIFLIIVAAAGPFPYMLIDAVIFLSHFRAIEERWNTVLLLCGQTESLKRPPIYGIADKQKLKLVLFKDEQKSYYTWKKKVFKKLSKNDLKNLTESNCASQHQSQPHRVQ